MVISTEVLVSIITDKQVIPVSWRDFFIVLINLHQCSQIHLKILTMALILFIRRKLRIKNNPNLLSIWILNHNLKVSNVNELYKYKYKSKNLLRSLMSFLDGPLQSGSSKSFCVVSLLLWFFPMSDFSALSSSSWMLCRLPASFGRLLKLLSVGKYKRKNIELFHLLTHHRPTVVFCETMDCCWTSLVD